MFKDAVHQKMLDSPVRKLGIKVSLNPGDTFFTQNDALKEIKLERIGEESKFFGFGVCHKANIKLIDKDRKLNISTANSFVIKHIVSEKEFGHYPVMYVSEVRRNENTNELSITTYDKLYEASSRTVSELDVHGQSYTLREFAQSCAGLLGLTFATTDKAFDLSYPNGANFEGTETIREALDDLAEATQTIYFISDNKLVFKMLDKQANAVTTLSKNHYYTLKSKDNRRLQTIANVTELGDNTALSTGLIGSTQYIRDNAFWSLREDIATLLQQAINRCGDLTIAQINCTWRGNYLLEIGDCIDIVTKDNKTITSYFLNDTLTYNGALNQNTHWNYEETQETESNPANLGDALNQTFARVDKANKRIDLVASDVDKNKKDIAQIVLESESVNVKVEKSVNKVTVLFALGDSRTIAPETGWSEKAPENDGTKVMWQKTIVAYNSGEVTESVTCISGSSAAGAPGKDGADGKPGKDGVDGKPGTNGTDGKDGVGIKQTTTQFYYSDSETELIGGEWKDTQDVWISSKFIWTRTKIIKTDESISYSDPVFAKTLNDALRGIEDTENRVNILDNSVSNLSVNAKDIVASVDRIEKTVDKNNASIQEDILTIKKSVSSKMTEDEVKLEIKKELDNGVAQVKTNRGFTFNDAGLKVSKSDSEMETLITEDGMRISRNNQEVLVASNQGVDAENLHATTYLIIGKNSRFEDYGNRTGCFWIG